MKFAKFMASPTGRITRIVAGVVLIVLGILLQSGAGIALVIIGLIPLLAGLFDWCVLAPLLGMPFTGKAIRAGEVKPER
ncbi:MAG: YgaP family membrane protein [Lacisediminihabitans sp.]